MPPCRQRLRQREGAGRRRAGRRRRRGCASCVRAASSVVGSTARATSRTMSLGGEIAKQALPGSTSVRCTKSCVQQACGNLTWTVRGALRIDPVEPLAVGGCRARPCGHGRGRPCRPCWCAWWPSATLAASSRAPCRGSSARAQRRRDAALVEVGKERGERAFGIDAARPGRRPRACAARQRRGSRRGASRAATSAVPARSTSLRSLSLRVVIASTSRAWWAGSRRRTG